MRGNPVNGKDVSAMVQHLAASKVLDILTPPEQATGELEMKVKDDAATLELKENMNALAAAQIKALEGGRSTLKDVAESTIIEHSPDDIADAEIIEAPAASDAGAGLFADI